MQCGKLVHQQESQEPWWYHPSFFYIVFWKMKNTWISLYHYLYYGQMYDLMNKKNCRLLDCKLNLRGEYLVKPVLILGACVRYNQKRGRKFSKRAHFTNFTRAYSRHWGHGCVFLRAHSLKKVHFVCLHPLNRYHFWPFLMKIFFSKLRALDWMR